MPKLSTEHYGTGDHSWLGSMHGISNARTVSLDVRKFTKADHYVDGYIPAGQPITLDQDGVAGPYDPDAETGGDFHGFLLTDQLVEEDYTTIPVPLLDHGRVIVSKVPTPGFVAPDASRDKTTFVYA